MKRLAPIAGVAIVAALLLPAPTSAQMNVVALGNLNDMTADHFACGAGGAICNLYHRIYADVDPRDVNGQTGGPVDGWPDYRAKPLRYLGDSNTTQAFPIIANTSACEGWYNIWTGVIGPDLGTFISYYGSQSQIINFGDRLANPNFVDCSPGTGINACFGALDTTFSRPSSPNTPVGASVGPLESLTAVPIPSVTATDTAGGTVSLSWPGAAAANTLNVPSTDGNVCPPGSTFDDLTATSGPNPVYGVGLFVHAIPSGGGFRSLASLEGGGAADGVLSVLQNPGTQLACTGASDCPGVHPVPCTGITGAACVGDGLLFAPTAQAITLTQGEVDAALGTDGPLDSSNVAVFNTKVFFRGSVAGSHAKAGVAAVNPSVVSLFSANSTRVSFGALVSSVVFDGAPVVQGNQVTLSWSTIGGPFVEFRVQRSDNGIEFTEVGVVPATGADSYQFTDTFRGRQPSSATYRLIVVEPTGESHILTSVDLSPGSRSPRR